MRASHSHTTTHRPWGWALGAIAGALVVLGILAPASPSVEAQSATATETVFAFEDNDPALRYTGNDWNLVQDSRAHGGTVQQARIAGSMLRLQFNGPYFKWYGVRGPNRGFARVLVDGDEIDTVDLYRPGDPSYELIMWKGGLNSERSHTLVIEVLGQRNGAASDTLVAVDWIEVQSAERTPLTPTPASSATPTSTPTAAASATAQVSATSTPGDERPPGSWPIDSRFLRYYVERDGLRILGNTISPPTFFAGHFTQYFEKGRLEDQTGTSNDPNWQFQYGLLVDELQAGRVALAIGGETSTITYELVNELAQASRRVDPPAGFTGGTATNSDGSVFVPYSQALQVAPGHVVHSIFWPYMSRTDLFPGGWLHDIGLPMTEAIPALVTKGTLADRNILVQVFQRTILTYDPLNPAEFRVERANVGTDYRRAFPSRVPQ